MLIKNLKLLVVVWIGELDVEEWQLLVNIFIIYYKQC